MKGAGYTYQVLYVNINSDWVSTYSALTSNGMQAVLQQGHVDDAFFQDPATGTSTGKDNAAAARSVNYPQGADFCLDVEGTTPSKSTLITWINNWAAQISGRLRARGVLRRRREPHQLRAGPGDAARGEGVLTIRIDFRARPGQGYVLVQSLSINGPCGFSIDPDNAKIDLNGNTLHGSG